MSQNNKIKKEELEDNRISFEIGFEEGYNTAKRIYKAVNMNFCNESGEIIQGKIRAL